MTSKPEVPEYINKHIYVLRYEGEECYYDLAVFRAAESLKAYVSAFDGKDSENGDAVYRCGHDGETFDIVRIRVGEVSDDGDIGTIVGKITRDWVEDGDVRVWNSTFDMKDDAVPPAPSAEAIMPGRLYIYLEWEELREGKTADSKGRSCPVTVSATAESCIRMHRSTRTYTGVSDTQVLRDFIAERNARVVDTAMIKSDEVELNGYRVVRKYKGYPITITGVTPTGRGTFSQWKCEVLGATTFKDSMRAAWKSAKSTINQALRAGTIGN
jgi:hypothetical protein